MGYKSGSLQDIPEGHRKEIEKIAKTILTQNEKLRKMGYSVYLANDMANIMIGPSHTDGWDHEPLHENSVYAFTLRGWDGGDW